MTTTKGLKLQPDATPDQILTYLAPVLDLFGGPAAYKKVIAGHMRRLQRPHTGDRLAAAQAMGCPHCGGTNHELVWTEKCDATEPPDN